MKEKIIIGLNIALVFAVILLFLLFFKGRSKHGETGKTSTSTAPIAINHNFPIAYINSDTVLFNYALYHKLKSEMETKQSRLEGDYSHKMKQLETERSALDTELDSVKAVITKNIERSFKTF